VDEEGVVNPTESVSNYQIPVFQIPETLKKTMCLGWTGTKRVIRNFIIGGGGSDT
jgi:hypothetical protein